MDEPEIRVDYFSIVDPDTLEDVPDVTAGALVAVAGAVTDMVFPVAAVAAVTSMAVPMLLASEPGARVICSPRNS